MPEGPLALPATRIQILYPKHGECHKRFLRRMEAMKVALSHCTPDASVSLLRRPGGHLACAVSLRIAG